MTRISQTKTFEYRTYLELHSHCNAAAPCRYARLLSKRKSKPKIGVH